eukprot:1008260-Prymnesium_polylepis.2
MHQLEERVVCHHRALARRVHGPTGRPHADRPCHGATGHADNVAWPHASQAQVFDARQLCHGRRSRLLLHVRCLGPPTVRRRNAVAPIRLARRQRIGSCVFVSRRPRRQ